MKFFHIKTLAAIGAFMFGIMAGPMQGTAANPENVDANITNVGALTVAHVADIEFGQWFLGWTASTIVLSLASSTGAVTPTLNGNTATSLSTPTEGQLTVTLPGASNTVIHMTHAGVTDFTDPAYELSAINYSDTVTTNGDFTAGTSVPVTVVADNVAETVSFGGAITVSAQPAPGNDSASFDVTFIY